MLRHQTTKQTNDASVSLGKDGPQHQQEPQARLRHHPHEEVLLRRRALAPGNSFPKGDDNGDQHPQEIQAQIIIEALPGKEPQLLQVQQDVKIVEASGQGNEVEPEKKAFAGDTFLVETCGELHSNQVLAGDSLKKAKPDDLTASVLSALCHLVSPLDLSTSVSLYWSCFACCLLNVSSDPLKDFAVLLCARLHVIRFPYPTDVPRGHLTPDLRNSLEARSASRGSRACHHGSFQRKMSRPIGKVIIIIIVIVIVTQMVIVILTVAVIVVVLYSNTDSHNNIVK